jgi:DNA polymerase III subunit gamma/tau
MRLDLKYRPQIFENLIGQPLVIDYLKTMIRCGAPRPILLHGPAGSGKTSACRIYARALLCERISSDYSPCNDCKTCRLALKQLPEYLEISGAEAGNIGDIRRIEEIARTPCVWSETYRVVNIDECHGLTKPAWDVLLKLLEEPPDFLVFILTTTEPGKVIPAIRSRCQTLKVNPLDRETAIGYLRKIADSEKISYEPRALELITYISHGQTRDLLNNLDQATLLGRVTVENTRALLSLDYINQLTAVWRALLANDREGLRAALWAWPADPPAILQTWREFALFLMSRQTPKISFALDPMFEDVPAVEVAAIVNGLTIRAARAGVSLDEALLGLMRIWDTASAGVLLQIELLFLDLASVLNSESFDLTNWLTSRDFRLGRKAAAWSA